MSESTSALDSCVGSDVNTYAPCEASRVDGRGMFGALHRMSADANAVSVTSLPLKAPSASPVERMPFYHGALDVEDVKRRLRSQGDYLLRIDPNDRRFFLSVRQSGDKLGLPRVVHQELVKAADHGSTYRLPTRPHASNVLDYIYYYARRNIPVIANAYLKRAVSREGFKSCRTDIGNTVSDEAIILPPGAGTNRNSLLPFGFRPLQSLYYFHGVLSENEAANRCNHNGKAGSFLLWVNARDGTVVLSVSDNGGGVTHVGMNRTPTSQGDRYDYRLPSGEGAQTEEQFVNYHYQNGVAIFDNVFLEQAVSALQYFKNEELLTCRQNTPAVTNKPRLTPNDIQTSVSNDILTASSMDIATALPENHFVTPSQSHQTQSLTGITVHAPTVSHVYENPPAPTNQRSSEPRNIQTSVSNNIVTASTSNIATALLDKNYQTPSRHSINNVTSSSTIDEGRM